MQTIINVLVFILILGIIIFIHELGHFLAAKFFGVYCAQFSLGFGPKIFSKKGKETEYELRLLPFGGFVAMAGEEDQVDNEDMKDIPVERTIKGLKTYQKVIVFLAGIFMNFVLAIIVTFGVNVVSGEVPLNIAQVGQVVENSAAMEAGIQEGDLIKEIDVVETGDTFIISNFNEISFNQEKLNTKANELTMIVSLERNHKDEKIKMKVDYNQEEGRYVLGIMQATRPMKLSESFKYTFLYIGEMSVAIFSVLGMLVTKFSSTVTQLSGPAGIYQVTSEVVQQGQVAYLFNLLAMLSVNVGIFNLLPIPGLDGCQVLFALIEKAIGKELPHKVKLTLQLIGLGLVLFLMVFVTYQDFSRIFS